MIAHDNVTFHCGICGKQCGNCDCLEKEIAKRSWPRPIPVSERLPEGECLAFYKFNDRVHSCWWAGCYYSKSAQWYDPFFETASEPRCNEVTHWLPMPLPPSPTE